jgi:hypothetical protein
MALLAWIPPLTGRPCDPVGSMKSPDPCPIDVGRPDAPSIPDVRSWGGRAALYLLALVRAHHSRARIAPTTQGTREVLAVLATLGLIRIDEEFAPEGQIVAGDKKMSWAYTWPHIPFAELEVNRPGIPGGSNS